MRRLLALLMCAVTVQAAMPTVYCLTEDGSVPSPDDDGCAVATTKNNFADLWTQIKNDSVANCFSWDVCAHVLIKIFPKTGGWSGGFEMNSLTPDGITGSITVTVPDDEVTTIDCGGSGATGIGGYISYMHIRGVTVAGMPNFRIQNCSNGVGFPSWTAVGSSLSHVYVKGRDDAASTAVFVSNPGVTIHDNIFENGSWTQGSTGIGMTNNDVAVVNAYNNEIVGYMYNIISVFPGSTYRDNLIGGRVNPITTTNGYINYGGAKDGGNTMERNAIYSTDHCMQPENGGPEATMDYARWNICGNNTWNLHNEGGGMTTWIHNTVHGCPAYGTMTCTAVGRGENLTTAHPQYLFGNILGEARVYEGSTTYIYGIEDPEHTTTDYNALWLAPGPSETLKYGFDVNGYYQTSANWLAASTNRYDQHSVVDQDPRYVGNKDLFYGVSGRFTCPGCVTIQDKVKFVRKNYMPTNLALKGRGCSWNGSVCTPDGSDLGAVSGTVCNTTGANMSTSLTRNGGTDKFRGGFPAFF